MSDVQVLPSQDGKLVELPSATLLIKKEDAGGHIIGELTAQPGFQGPGHHEHADQAETFYVLEGTFQFAVAGHEVEIGPGATITIPPGTTHNFANTSDRPARLLVVGAAEELDLY
jgi:mannose-6-phosphate isomerase-like protein (cupin superfamily)